MTEQRPEEAFRAEVLSLVGHDPGPIEPGCLQRFSTTARRWDDSGWCLLFEDRRGGVGGDFRSGVRFDWSATPRERMSPLERSLWARQLAAHRQKREAERVAEWTSAEAYIAHLWADCVSVTKGDPVSRYLCRRLALDSFTPPECVRLHPKMNYSHEGQRIGLYPAMVAPITDAAGKILALHRTYLTPHGEKAGVPGAVKKLTKACGPLIGGSIKLYEPARAVLGIAEGLETALAAFLGSAVPTQAAYSAGALAGFVWPRGLRRLVVFGDADTAGRDAAAKLRERTTGTGLSCRVMVPLREGADWADVWFERGGSQ
jgi:putative DNA primase/helicase